LQQLKKIVGAEELEKSIKKEKGKCKRQIATG
jgi:hypothetical protein